MEASADLVKATALLLRLVRGVERWAAEEDGTIHDGVWDAYEQTRVFLDCPVVLFSGGSEGEHYHESDFDPDKDVCCWCEAWADERAATAEP